ncbi:hypothetical protein ACMFMG_005620 [Clarireedia jacksonii]
MATTETEISPAFPSFRKLPTEIQISIWSHTLEAPRIIPRIVRLDFDTTTEVFTYKSTPPPLTQTCRLSRIVALKHYQLLLPTCASIPIYFHPQTDILHCNPSYRPSSPTVSPSASSPLSPPPFIDPSIPPELIHHIILTQTYISHRARASFLCPIPELRHLVSLRTLYIELPTHSARAAASRSWYANLMRFTPPSSSSSSQSQSQSSSSSPNPSTTDGLPSHIANMYASEKRQEEENGRRDVVPGYVIVGGKEKCMREQQVMSCFGWQEGGVRHAWLCGDKGYPVRCDEYWEERGLPIVEHLREVE